VLLKNAMTELLNFAIGIAAIAVALAIMEALL
jgi:hypothetical protein